MRRLFGCTVSLLYEDARGEATLNAPIARRQVEMSYSLPSKKCPIDRVTLEGSAGASFRCPPGRYTRRYAELAARG